MSENNSTSHNISLAEAIDLKSRYRNNRIGILKDEYSQSDILPICETFDKEAFSNFFNNEACKSIRIYYGMTTNLQVHAIVVGADAEGRDMLPVINSLSEQEDDDENVILEEGQRCPPSCPDGSPLNEDNE